MPRSREALEALPGVGRKTANVVLNVAFGEPTFAVDTHVFRVCNRTGLAPGKTPQAVEHQLSMRVPAAYRVHAHHWLILHGRYVCQARRPQCWLCGVSAQCHFAAKTTSRMKRAALLLLALLWLPACRAEVTVTDDSGHAVTLAVPAARVVSLAPHLTEMVFAVGGGGTVKAVIRYSDYPAAARELPVVGDAFALDFEAIVRLKPDLVLVWTSGLNERHRARLRGLGLTLFESEIRSADAIADTLRRLGTLLGHGDEAGAAAARFERDWQSVA